MTALACVELPPSEPDGGATAATPSASRLRAVESPQVERLRVVVADDHPGIRLMLTTIIGLEADFELVGEAATGTEAVARVEQGDVDLLVLDLSMPELDGLEVLRRLAEMRATTATVVYTGLTRTDVVRSARSLGARDVVIKGVAPEVLVERLRAAGS